MVKKTTLLPKSSRSKRIDPLTLAKQKILAALKTQNGYVALEIEGKPFPKNNAGREASTWFSKQTDGWYTTIRYGQTPIMIVGGQPDMLISEKLEDVAAFYDAVSLAISKGELDVQIAKLQAEKSASLSGTR